jgi:hypothetical protein
VEYSLAPDIRRLCQVRVDELTQVQYDKLTDFALYRLLKLKLPLSLSRDMVNGAVLAVLQGTETDCGRKPRLEDVETRQAFHDYLIRVIKSRVEGLTRCRDKHVVPEDLPPEITDATFLQPDRAASLLDFKETLFTDLRRMARPGLMPTIDAWEEVCLNADRIPTVDGLRKHAWEVRQLAKAVVAKIGDLN